MSNRSFFFSWCFLVLAWLAASAQAASLTLSVTKDWVPEQANHAIIRVTLPSDAVDNNKRSCSQSAAPRRDRELHWRTGTGGTSDDQTVFRESTAVNAPQSWTSRSLLRSEPVVQFGM